MTMAADMVMVSCEQCDDHNDDDDADDKDEHDHNDDRHGNKMMMPMLVMTTE